MEIKEFIDIKKKIIDSALGGYLPKDRSQLASAMRYAVLSGGKRIRPLLAIAAFEACGGRSKGIVPVACAIEFIHAFTLIHDDLPAIDNSDLRRGKPTVHRKFGEDVAILAGDALLAHAFGTVVKNINGNAALRIVTELSASSGVEGVISGEMMDIEFEQKNVALKGLKDMYALKTGSLISASVRCGAIFGCASKTELSALTCYALHLGVAFQVIDDILDIVGSTSVTGKITGSDKAKGKSTVPGLLGMKKAKEVAKEELRLALRAIRDFGQAADPLRGLAALVVERNQ